MPPLASSRKVAASRSSKPRTAVPSSHELAEKPGDGRTTSKAKGKQKAKDESPEKRKISAMLDVNTSLQTLSSVAQSGWKANSEEGRTKSSAFNKVSAAVSCANEALSCLRVICSDDLDVERAASSMMSKLLVLEMYDTALPFLSNMHGRFLALLRVPDHRVPVHSSSTSKSPVHLLSLPLPTILPPADTMLLTLISTYLMHSITLLAHLAISSSSSTTPDLFSAALLESGTILTWMPCCVSLPSKHIDTVLTRTYSVLTKSCSSISASSRSTFLIRMYALRCLLCTSVGTVQPNTFWEQVQKSCAAYVKSSSPMSEAEELSVARLVSESLGEVVQIAQSRSSFVEGKSFVLLCETWTSFAKRSNDLCTLDRITDLMGPGSTSCSSAEVDNLADNISKLNISAPSPKDKDTVVLECARACAVLTKVTASLDAHSDGTDDFSKRVHDAAKFLPGIGSLLYFATEPNDELHRAQGKLQRTLERLRRACIKVLDADSKDQSHATISLLTAISTTLEGTFKQNPNKDILTASLDSLFILARMRLKCNDPDTYTPTLDLLNHTIVLVDSTPDHANAIPVSARANYIRCISGAYHNMAGMLYQSSKYGGAVRFLKEGCLLGARALRMRAGAMEDSPEDEREEGWKQLEEQMFRRWELLSVCYSKMGDRKLACDGLVESVKAFPYGSSGLEHLARSTTPSHAFSANPSSKQLGGIVDRLTYAATCELFLPPTEVSLLTVLKSGAISDEVLGLLLERQISTLEPCIRKDGVEIIVRGLLQDALSVYKAAVLPLPRVRILLKCMEFLWRDGNANGGETRWTAEHLGEEILHLLAVEDLVHDSAFDTLRFQYTVAVHLWLSLFAYRSAGSPMTSAVSYHVEEACNILRGLIPDSPTDTNSKTKRSPRAKKSPKETVPAKKPTRAMSVRTTNKTRVQNPVTPRPRKALENVSNVIQSTPPKQAGATIDFQKVVIVFDLETIIGQLQMNIHLLGLLGLVLQKIKLLEALKRICERQLGLSADLYIIICVDLASEYVKLGKTKRANSIFARSSAVMKSSDVSDEVRISYLLRYAEILALGNNVLGSASSYCEAMGLSEASLPEDKSLPTAERIRLRAGRLERAAMACRVSAAIQYSRNNVVGALECTLQSLRLWNRAVDTLSRLNQPSSKPTKATDDSNPFEATPTESSSAHDIRATDHPRSLGQKRLMDGMEWRMVEELLSTLLTLTHAYFTRGSSREAEYFAQQAQDLAESVNAPTMVARALMRKGEIQLYQKQLGTGRDSLVKAAELLQDMPGVDAADMRRLNGYWNCLNEQAQDARDLYEEASAMLGALEEMLASFDGSRRKSSVTLSPQAALATAGQGAVVPTLLSDILRRHIWLLRDDGDASIKDLIERLMALPTSQDTKGEEHALMGKLTLHSVYDQFRSDMFLSSLAESTIALPMGMTSDRAVSLTPSTQDILSALDHAEKLFWADLALTADRGHVPHVREATINLALIKALQTSLGKGEKDGPIIAARLLDASSAITLRREMLETIQHKFPSVQGDDLEWPLMTPSGSPLPRKSPSNFRRLRTISAEEEASDDDNDSKVNMKAYWETIRKTYAEQTSDASLLSTTAMSQLPPHWTVVHISLTPDKSTLFISRQNVSSEPLMFCVPLKGRRESDGDEHLTFDDAVKELAEIIRLSDQGTRNAVNVRNDDPQARSAWWAERNNLDKRLQELLENIEFCWLGAFKTILSPVSPISAELIADLGIRLEKVFKRILPPPDKKQKQSPRLSDALLNCFSSLSPRCREEELEDLLFFILDLYTFHGIPVAIADIDVDQVTVDIRCALEEHATFKNKRGKMNSASVDDSHIFLVLDHNVQGVPWESIPVLRGQSMSRIPSVSFLLDRVRLASAENRSGGAVDRISVDPRKTFFVLNPSGDLKGTEGRFKPWLEQMRSVGWEGVIGRPPSEQQFLDALARKDLVVYFGHGGGEQYVRSHKIRHLPRCAATMLWGCSSGSLKEMGDFDRVGTPFNYMLAGCPLLVANLWDVTDRDIDKFSQAVFDSLRLTPTRSGEQGMSVVTAIAQAREACKLKYLTGAAPVVYGIPFYL
ncbi:peptidase family C50-domain-containing protein [Suillus clintonianus]|uniref:peptidase family C50-domain-containing protein n=1 Tax=Suillus clintonianus TaxID=1904413 RepID=UPI001B880E6E|nr:peptidase family C50-domain-containing protein [Suillus clintonianus]KAG2136721.1 peptidase family C50-domain-containing protein [Suillus clintonianus]